MFVFRSKSILPFAEEEEGEGDGERDDDEEDLVDEEEGEEEGLEVEGEEPVGSVAALVHAKSATTTHNRTRIERRIVIMYKTRTG